MNKSDDAIDAIFDRVLRGEAALNHEQVLVEPSIFSGTAIKRIAIRM